MVEVFNMFDTDGDNLIDAEDLRRIFIEIGYDVSEEDCELLVKMNDEDQDGYLDFTEFTAAFMAR